MNNKAVKQEKHVYKLNNFKTSITKNFKKYFKIRNNRQDQYCSMNNHLWYIVIILHIIPTTNFHRDTPQTFSICYNYVGYQLNQRMIKDAYTCTDLHIYYLDNFGTMHRNKQKYMGTTFTVFKVSRLKN